MSHLYVVGDRVAVVAGVDAGKRGTVMRVIDQNDVPGQGQYLTVKLDGEDVDLTPTSPPWYPHFIGVSLIPLHRE